jgi:hypothetical protein
VIKPLWSMSAFAEPTGLTPKHRVSISSPWLPWIFARFSEPGCAAVGQSQWLGAVKRVGLYSELFQLQAAGYR